MSTTPYSNAQDIALNLADKMGWHVFPVSVSEVDGKKRVKPINDWPNEATTDPALIRMMPWNGAMVGVLTGVKSDLTVLDQDEGKDLVLPLTLVCGTRREGGRHYFYRYLEGMNSRQGWPAPGWDVRSDGGFVIWWNDIRNQGQPINELEGFKPPVSVSDKPSMVAHAPDAKVRGWLEAMGRQGTGHQSVRDYAAHNAAMSVPIETTTAAIQAAAHTFDNNVETLITSAYEKYYQTNTPTPEAVEGISKAFPAPKPFGEVEFPAMPQMLFGEWLAPVGLNVVYARAGIGKTGWLVELMRAMRTGSRFMGQQAFRAFDGRILWVNGDLHPALAGVQLRSLGDIGVDYMDMFNPETGLPFNLSEPAAWALMKERMAPYNMVLFDTRSSLFKGDHMDQEQTDALFTNLQSVGRDRCIWLAMHAGKPNLNSASSTFGSSSAEWYVDNIIGLDRFTQTQWNKSGNTPATVKEAVEELQDINIGRNQAFIIDHEKAKWGAPFATQFAGWKAAVVDGMVVKNDRSLHTGKLY